MERELEDMRALALRMVGKLAHKEDLTPSEIDNATKAVCLIDKIDGREMMEKYGDDYDNEPSSRSWDHSMDSSYRRGRSMTTGRYVSRSGHSVKDRAISKLEEMMDKTSSQYERDELGHLINGIRMMEDYPER